ncbi:MAG: FmdB family zinc ribbon protein [Actinomycetota bacterium]
MPTYEYVCTACGERIEILQPIGDRPLRKCPVCGGALRKVFHPAGIVFKGSGFYRTDARPAESRAGGDGAKSEAGVKTEAGAKSEAGVKTEKKKEAKTSSGDASSKKEKSA